MLDHVGPFRAILDHFGLLLIVLAHTHISPIAYYPIIILAYKLITLVDPSDTLVNPSDTLEALET